MVFHLILFQILGRLLICLIVSYIYAKYVSYQYWQKKKVLCDQSTFPVGNFGSVLMNKIHPGVKYQILYEKFKQHRYFGAYVFTKPVLIVRNPKLVQVILSKEFTHFHDRVLFDNEENDPLSANVITTTGQKWRNLRFKLGPAFTIAKIKILFNGVRDTGDELSRFFEENHGKDLEIYDIFSRFTTDVITRTAFGIEANALKNLDNVWHFYGKEFFKSRPVKNILAFILPQMMKFFKLRYFEKSMSDFFINAFEETFKARLENPNPKPIDFLDFLVQLIQGENVKNDQGNVLKPEDTIEGKLTVLQGVAQACIFFMAGFETSSTVLTFCLYELAMNPEIQEKVCSEIFEVIEKHGGVTYESLNNMIYLGKVIDETMRKYPVVIILNRVCTEDIDLPTTDLRIEKGTTVLIPVLGLHRDPEIWPNPEEFDPERFSAENVASRHPYTYLPFGQGLRVFLGMKFGIMKTKIGIIAALTTSRFKVSHLTKYPLEIESGSFVYRYTNPLYLVSSPLLDKIN